MKILLHIFVSLWLSEQFDMHHFSSKSEQATDIGRIKSE